MRWLVVVVLLVILGWFGWVYRQIEATADIDNAQPADAIAVFGAAEYAGRPSPVLHARLDKAVSLYDKGMAPVIVTLGGGVGQGFGQDRGGVGRDYLLANGVPFDKIIAETKSFDTEEQVNSLADIAGREDFHHIIVVSDGTHLFRIALLCRRAGLEVYTSPRAALGHIDDIDRGQADDARDAELHGAADGPARQLAASVARGARQGGLVASRRRRRWERARRLPCACADSRG